MKIAFRLFALIALLGMTTGAWAQMEFSSQEQLCKYQSLWKSKLWMDIKIPNNFNIRQLEYGKWPFSNKHNTNALNVPGGVVFSDSKDIMIVYPYIMVASMETKRSLSSLASELEKEAKTTAKREVFANQQFCNADTVIISEQSLATPYANNYTHLITILTQKKHYMPLYFRIFMNEEGYKEKEGTVKTLLGSISYLDVKDYKLVEKNIGNYAYSVDSKVTGIKPGKVKYEKSNSSTLIFDPNIRIK